MSSNPDFADIVDYATRIGVKVAVALDHQQLQAVENGGGASLVTRKRGYVQLPEPVRFSEEWERSASLRLREGKISALADYAEHGRIRAGTADEILEAAAQAYIAHTLAGKDALVIARSHELRREACRRVRDDLQHLGLMARDGRSIEIADGQRASVGDLIVCTDNDHSVDAGEAGNRVDHGRWVAAPVLVVEVGHLATEPRSTTPACPAGGSPPARFSAPRKNGGRPAVAR